MTVLNSHHIAWTVCNKQKQTTKPRAVVLNEGQFHLLGDIQQSLNAVLFVIVAGGGGEVLLVSTG